MERWAPNTHVAARSHFNMTLNSTVRDTPWTAQNQTRRLIANLQLAQVQAVRTTHVTLGAFSLALVLLTVHRIISDARRAAATKPQESRSAFSFLGHVHSADTFPLVLACGSAVQQIIFVAVQATSLNSVLSDHCRSIAMVTYPAIFIMGYLTLVFGAEMTVRAFKGERFALRGKWNTTTCLGVVGFLLILTWLPTVIWPMANRCFGGLVWFPVRYEAISIGILSVLVSFCLILAAALSIQLMRTSNMDTNERIAASRMCYYLLIAAMIYTLVMPVQIQAHRRDFMNTLTTSRIAEIALFSSGILITFFHLFLRVNASRMVINPVGTHTPQKQKRPRIRFFGPSDLEMNISGPLALAGRPESRQGLVDEKSRYDFNGYNDFAVRSEKLPLSPGSVKSNGLMDSTKWPLPPDPIETTDFAVPKDEPNGLHKRTKSGYSLFPTRAEDIPRLPATVYSPPKSEGTNASNLAVRHQNRRSSLADAKSVTDVNEAYNWLSAPAPLFAKKPHRRDQSTDSSATVQIGLRFSVAPAAIAAAQCTAINRALNPHPMPPPIRRDNTDSSGVSLDLPIQAPSSLTSTLVEDVNAAAFPQPPSSAISPSKTGPGRTPAFPVLSPNNSGSNLPAARDKILPPTPSARTAQPGPPPQSAAPAPPQPAVLSGLRMNPVSPDRPQRTSPTTRSPPIRSPGAGLSLGSGTIARSPPPDGWI